MPCLHSIGAPLAPGQQDALWPCAPIEQKYISHFPEENLIWSYGSGYGGNALLGKKCFALRIASTMAKREGWMAEHMLILRLTSPEGKQYHIAAAFPSACGKTNLAMLQPTIPGWKAETHRRRYRLDEDRPRRPALCDQSRRRASSAWRRAPRTTRIRWRWTRCGRISIFTNCVLTDDGDIWWEGMGVPTAGTRHRLEGPRLALPRARSRARIRTPVSPRPRAQCPVISRDWENPEGVPIDIFVFGGRRAGVVPLVTEAYDWDHGVFMGATASSETTAANIGAVGNLRRDPFAMQPFCGYNMADYFQHWLDMGDRLGDKAPRIFYVNWFRKTADGKWLWPGYGENSRVLEWMCERVEGRSGAPETRHRLSAEPGDLEPGRTRHRAGGPRGAAADRHRRLARRAARHRKALRPVRRPAAGAAGGAGGRVAGEVGWDRYWGLGTGLVVLQPLSR